MNLQTLYIIFFFSPFFSETRMICEDKHELIAIAYRHPELFLSQSIFVANWLFKNQSHIIIHIYRVISDLAVCSWIFCNGLFFCRFEWIVSSSFSSLQIYTLHILWIFTFFAYICVWIIQFFPCRPPTVPNHWWKYSIIMRETFQNFELWSNEREGKRCDFEYKLRFDASSRSNKLRFFWYQNFQFGQFCKFEWRSISELPTHELMCDACYFDTSLTKSLLINVKTNNNSHSLR